jgi:hypothetical protein
MVVGPPKVTRRASVVKALGVQPQARPTGDPHSASPIVAPFEHSAGACVRRPSRAVHFHGTDQLFGIAAIPSVFDRVEAQARWRT